MIWLLECTEYDAYGGGHTMTQIFDGFPSRDQLGFVFNGWGLVLHQEEAGRLVMGDDLQTVVYTAYLFTPEIIKGKGEN